MKHKGRFRDDACNKLGDQFRRSQGWRPEASNTEEGAGSALEGFPGQKAQGQRLVGLVAGDTCPGKCKVHVGNVAFLEISLQSSSPCVLSATTP